MMTAGSPSPPERRPAISVSAHFSAFHSVNLGQVSTFLLNLQVDVRTESYSAGVFGKPTMKSVAMVNPGAGVTMGLRAPNGLCFSVALSLQSPQYLMCLAKRV